MAGKGIFISRPPLLACALAFFLPWSIAGVEIVLTLGLLSVLIDLFYARPPPPDLPWSRMRAAIEPAKPLLAPLGLLFVATSIADLHAAFTGPAARAAPLMLEPVWRIVALIVPALLLSRLEDTRHAVTVLLVTGTVVALYGILQHFTGIDVARIEPLTRELVPGSGRYRVIGFYSHPLTFAYAYAFILFFALARALSPTAPGDRWLGVAAAVLIELVLWLTGARGAWLATGVSLCALLAFRGVLRAPGAARVAIAVLLLVPPLVLWTSPALQDRALQVFRPDDQRARLVFWKTAATQLEATPLLGIGAGNFRRVVGPEIQRIAPDISPPRHAHQLYLQLWLEAGITGFAAFLWLCARWIRLGVEGVHSRSPAARALALGALGGLGAFMLGGFTQDTLGDAEVQRMLGFAGAVILAVARTDGRTALLSPART